jgi:hypothetical protein
MRTLLWGLAGFAAAAGLVSVTLDVRACARRRRGFPAWSLSAILSGTVAGGLALGLAMTP